MESQQFAVDKDVLLAHDLEEELSVNRRFDLVLCLEVAEHLSPRRAPGLVSDLCRLGDLVLFSAAVPGQGGIRHLNERWPTYWSLLFEAEDFESFDPIRPRIWHRSEVDWWYRQNVIVFARRGTSQAQVMARWAGDSPRMLDIVHPELLSTAANLLSWGAARRLVRLVRERLGGFWTRSRNR
jgi:hypothetical protein